MEEQKQNHRGYEVPLPDTRPGASPGSVNSVPIGESMPPPPPKPGGRPVQFRVLARWETAKPVRLAGAPEVPARATAGHAMTDELAAINTRIDDLP